jgi:transcriptional regulator with XRE-family HTH domain
MTSDHGHTRELGEFLRSRRARLSPADVGLPHGSGTRRVPGLRREELAIIAGISPDHYQRIEQGRSTPSVPALRAIADALSLTADEEHYLRRLAAPESTGSAPAPSAADGETTRIPDHLLRLVEYSPQPVFLLNHRRDILAWNRIGAALLTDFGAIDVENRNLAWLLFTDSRFRSLYRDWDEATRTIVHLIARLETASPEFRRIRARREVAQKTGGLKTLDHPVIGPITVTHQVLGVNGHPDLELVLHGAHDEASAHALQLLGAWDATRTGAGAAPRT